VKSLLNRKIVILATGLVLLVGAGGAVAATQLSGSSARQAYVNDVAKRLNVSPSALTSALKAAAIDRINAAQAAGRLTQSEATALKQRVENGKGLGFLARRAGRRGLRIGERAAVQYLGISPATLRTDLRSGKSLAQIAGSTLGKSVAGLKAAIIAAEKSKLDTAVKNGRITSQQEQQVLTRLSSRIDTLLNRTW
jgi:hypothetical protein